MLVHMSNLPLHGHKKQDPKVHDQNGPEDGHVKHGEKGHEKRYPRPPKARQPELEFWQSSREGFVFLRLLLVGW